MDFSLPEELRQLRMLVRRFVREELLPLEEVVEERDEFPEDLRRQLKAKAVELGLWTYAAPPEYGGAGIGLVGDAVVHEELGRVSPSIGYQGGVIGGLACGWTGHGAMAYATEEQKERYFLPVIRGEQEFYFAVTEPNAGSDAGAIETRAVRKGDSYIIDGNKIFITCVERSQFGLVFAVTDWEKRGRGGITCFIVDKDAPGFSIVRKLRLMGRRGLGNYELAFDGCVVPAANVYGREGQGLPIALGLLTVLRVLAGAVFTGTAERLYEMSREYAKQRVTFGKPIAERQAIQWMLVDMAMGINAARWMTYNAAWEADQGMDIRTKAAMVKLYATEMCFRVADNAMQIHGGYGYAKELPIERIFRDVRLYRIVEGTSEIMRMLIARDLLRD